MPASEHRGYLPVLWTLNMDLHFVKRPCVDTQPISGAIFNPTSHPKQPDGCFHKGGRSIYPPKYCNLGTAPTLQQSISGVILRAIYTSNLSSSQLLQSGGQFPTYNPYSRAPKKDPYFWKTSRSCLGREPRRDCTNLEAKEDPLSQKPQTGLGFIRGTFLGVPITRVIVFWGLYWCPLIS